MNKHITERPSVCPLDCPDTCSLTVEVAGDQLLKVKGSHANPFTNGTICNKVARSYPQFVHEFRPAGLDMNAEAEAVARKLRDEGNNPYFIPGGGSNPTGALGYASCAQEIADYSRETGQEFDWLVMATGSTGTQAGLVAGFHAIGHNLPVMGVSVRQPRQRQMDAVHTLTQKTLEKLGVGGIPLSKILVDDGYVGEGYGIPAPSTIEAISLLARQEGILLDPVYSAKGMSQYADGGIVGTKPYSASGNYISKMSDYCAHCRFDPKKATGDDACPFTTLYWDFLSRNRNKLEGNRRMGFQFKNLDRKNDDERRAIRKAAERLKRQLTSETYLT